MLSEHSLKGGNFSELFNHHSEERGDWFFPVAGVGHERELNRYALTTYAINSISAKTIMSTLTRIDVERCIKEDPNLFYYVENPDESLCALHSFLVAFAGS